MKLSDFDYNLPKELIAQQPAEPRDSSRLLVLDKTNGNIEHTIFNRLFKYLKKGDVLVFNNSKVIPARLIGRKETGGKVEVFLLNKINSTDWEALLNSKIKPGSIIKFSDNFSCEILSQPTNDKKWIVRFNVAGAKFKTRLDKYGSTPLPPYIKNEKLNAKETKKRYQTVYANSNKEGSVAAPTAGLHFTENLIAQLKKRGIQIEFITLHVGLGTFEPVRIENVKKHKMHAEFAEIDKKTLSGLQKAKQEKRRIISVGTTTARALEYFSSQLTNNYLTNQQTKDWVNIFIYPGYKFKVLDGLITNFHLPKSTLLMLVSALVDQKMSNVSKRRWTSNAPGIEIIKHAYQEAVKNKYHFYSFGDAMLII